MGLTPVDSLIQEHVDVEPIKYVENSRTILKYTDWSTESFGRTPEDGPWCGQNYREQVLVPAFRDYEFVYIDLEGHNRFHTSWLEEAFGGLHRVHGHKPSELERRIILIGGPSSVRTDIRLYLSATYLQ